MPGHPLTAHAAARHSLQPQAPCNALQGCRRRASHPHRLALRLQQRLKSGTLRLPAPAAGPGSSAGTGPRPAGSAQEGHAGEQSGAPAVNGSMRMRRMRMRKSRTGGSHPEARAAQAGGEEALRRPRGSHLLRNALGCCLLLLARRGLELLEPVVRHIGLAAERGAPAARPPHLRVLLAELLREGPAQRAQHVPRLAVLQGHAQAQRVSAWHTLQGARQAHTQGAARPGRPPREESEEARVRCRDKEGERRTGLT